MCCQFMDSGAVCLDFSFSLKNTGLDFSWRLNCMLSLSLLCGIDCDCFGYVALTEACL